MALRAPLVPPQPMGDLPPPITPIELATSPGITITTEALKLRKPLSTRKH